MFALGNDAKENGALDSCTRSGRLLDTVLVSGKPFCFSGRAAGDTTSLPAITGSLAVLPGLDPYKSPSLPTLHTHLPHPGPLAQRAATRRRTWEA